MNTDVLIAGAGPTGLMVAAELRLAGVDVLLVDRLAEPDALARAAGVHSRTLEILDQRGLLRPLLATGDHPRNPGNFAGLPFQADLIDERLTGRFIPQYIVEATLEQRLRQLGSRVHRSHELTAVTSDSEGIVATVAHDGHTRTIRAAYLVAADGAHSTVRTALGIDFPGTPARYTTAVADVWLAGRPFEGSGSQWRWAPEGDWATLIPYGDHFRLGLGGPSQPRDRRVPVSESEIRAGLASLFGLEPERIGYRFRITDAARQVRDYRHDRVFLAGDAAHVHLPFAGQGMNTGIQDAFDLGWKLAAAVHGWAAPGLLDTYHSERHPVGARVLANVAAQKSLLGWTDSVAPTELRDLFAELMRLPGPAGYLAGMISGQDIRYDMPGAPAHPLLGRAAPDRPLPDETGRLYHRLRSGRAVLLADPELAEAAVPWSDRLDIVPAPDAERLLIRPDGYIAWATGTPETLRSALTRWFGVRAGVVVRA
ncbi:FAD-dependent monooxygenase [Nocardia heshunensis]